VALEDELTAYVSECVSVYANSMNNAIDIFEHPGFTQTFPFFHQYNANTTHTEKYRKCTETKVSTGKKHV
jgi:hypothetical protein